MSMPHQLFIDGAFTDGVEGRTIEVHDPHDGSLITEIAEATEVDVDRAIDAASRAYPAWKSMAATDRGRLLLRLADAIEANGDELALLETRDTGHPLRDSKGLDLVRTAMQFRYFGGMADKFQGTVVPVDRGFLDYVVREPLGVVGSIVPWNFPMMFVSWKMAPALAAGNCVVMKPSELTPLTALRIAERAAEVGFPPGVINVVPGYGQTAGARLVTHPGIAKISFTGSTPVGRMIASQAAAVGIRTHLELGGKGANIVFADATIPKAVGGTAFGIFHNQGQACIAASRLIIHESVVDEFMEKFIALASSIKVGDPKDLSTEMGPLTSPMHRDRVLSYVKVAVDEGGEVLLGGKAPDDPALANGCYVEPTIVRPLPGTRVTREEVFGPFMSVQTFSTDEQALAIANETEFALGGGLWTNDLSRAHRMARDINAGMVWVNSYKRAHPGSPFGGMGASGYGREMGFEAMHEYTEAKAVWINVDADIPPFYPRG